MRTLLASSRSLRQQKSFVRFARSPLRTFTLRVLLPVRVWWQPVRLLCRILAGSVATVVQTLTSMTSVFGFSVMHQGRFVMTKTSPNHALQRL